MEGDGGLAGAGCQRKQDSIFVFRDRFEGVLNGDFLKVVGRLCAADIFKGNRIEFVFPFVGRRERFIPEFIGRGEFGNHAFFSRTHFNLINFLAVGSVSEVEFKFFSVVLGLCHTFTNTQIIAFGFYYCQFNAFVNQNIIGN